MKRKRDDRANRSFRFDRPVHRHDLCVLRAVLGFRRVDSPDGPTALHFGSQKINLHEVGRTFEPKAEVPTAGAGDFCLITRRSIDAVAAQLGACGVAIELGPVERTGARGPMRSVYFRDPDRNLIEVASYRRAAGRAE